MEKLIMFTIFVFLPVISEILPPYILIPGQQKSKLPSHMLPSNYWLHNSMAAKCHGSCAVAILKRHKASHWCFNKFNMKYGRTSDQRLLWFGLLMIMLIKFSLQSNTRSHYNRLEGSTRWTACLISLHSSSG